MVLILSTLWLIRALKHGLFWLYLWQLKEYHVGRFLDHFRTHKGRKLLTDFIQISKAILAFFSLFDSLWLYSAFLLLIMYIAEALLFFRSLGAKSVKKPVWTPKTIILSAILFAAAIFVSVMAFGLQTREAVLKLALFDIFTPVIVSGIVLLLQPFFVLIRGKTLLKAKHKMENLKPLSGLKVIAITGSYGKTSSKEFLAAILSKKFKVLSTKEHQNSEIGVAIIRLFFMFFLIPISLILSFILFLIGRLNGSNS